MSEMIYHYKSEATIKFGGHSINSVPDLESGVKIENMEADSAFVGLLPKGCEFCRRGSKMVLLVTGRCSTGCYYCPLSREKKGRGVMYANELRVEREEQLLEEAELMDAEGTGITGGDPVQDLERTLKAIRMLKGRFGDRHHIHLYTSTIDREAFMRLEEAGLDEIRVHPPLDLWEGMGSTCLEDVVAETGMEIGLEVPCIPGEELRLRSLVRWADDVGMKFVNLNELEFSETNSAALLARGFEVKDDVSSAVLGSERMALDILGMELRISRHYCSSSFKDGVQLRRRITRRAENVALDLDIITDDGTLVKGMLETDDPASVMALLEERFDVPPDLMRHDTEKRRVEVASWVLEDIAALLPQPAYEVEEYPTADRLEVERTPLNPAAFRRR